MRVGHVAPGSTIREGGGPQPLSASRRKSNEAFSSLLKLFISSSAWLRMKCPLGAMAPTGAAYPAAPRARSNLVRLANAAEKRAHAVGPTQRYVTRASPLPSPTPFSPFARFVRSHGPHGRDPEARPPRRAAREPRESSPDIFAIRRVDTLRGRAGAGKRPAVTPRASHDRARRGTVL